MDSLSNNITGSVDMALVMPWVTKIVTAIVILIVTWIVAKLTNWAFAKLVDRVAVMRKADGSGESIGTSLGKIVGLFVWLFGLIAILQVFELNDVIRPLQTLLNQVMGFIPNLVGAALIFFIGMMIAKIAKQLVEALMASIDAQGLAKRAGLASVTGTNQVSGVVGTVVFVLIIIPVAIAALQQLHMSAIADPATRMLNMVLTSIPLVLGAAIVLAIGYFIAKWVATLIETVLPGLGFDQAIASTGLVPANISASKVVGTIAMTALMLFAGIAATRMLNFPELSAILDQVLTLGGRVLFGSVVIAVGVMLANLIAKIVAASTGEDGFAPTMIKYLIIAVATFMGLTFMQIGEQIVIIGFTAFVSAAAVATALSFGLGGRETAHKLLERWTAGGDKPD